MRCFIKVSFRLPWDTEEREYLTSRHTTDGEEPWLEIDDQGELPEDSFGEPNDPICFRVIKHNIDSRIHVNLRTEEYGWGKPWNKFSGGLKNLFENPFICMDFDYVDGADLKVEEADDVLDRIKHVLPSIEFLCDYHRSSNDD